jgi:hypothetical protein
MSWVMASWTMLTMWLMAERFYKLAWFSSILSQFGWIYIAIESKLYGMVALAWFMLVIGIRALLKLRIQSVSP